MTDPWDEFGIFTDPWIPLIFYEKCISIYTSPMDPMGKGLWNNSQKSWASLDLRPMRMEKVNQTYIFAKWWWKMVMDPMGSQSANNHQKKQIQVGKDFQGNQMGWSSSLHGRCLPPTYIPGTANTELFYTVNVWLNNIFPCKDLELSSWNNRL